MRSIAASEVRCRSRRRRSDGRGRRARPGAPRSSRRSVRSRPRDARRRRVRPRIAHQVSAGVRTGASHSSTSSSSQPDERDRAAGHVERRHVRADERPRDHDAALVEQVGRPRRTSRCSSRPCVEPRPLTIAMHACRRARGRARRRPDRAAASRARRRRERARGRRRARRGCRRRARPRPARARTTGVAAPGCVGASQRDRHRAATAGDPPPERDDLLERRRRASAAAPQIFSTAITAAVPRRPGPSRRCRSRRSSSTRTDSTSMPSSIARRARCRSS